MIFSPQFIYMVYHIDCFADIELSLYLWDKSYLIMVYDQLILNLVANILLKNFTSRFIIILASNFLLF